MFALIIMYMVHVIQTLRERKKSFENEKRSHQFERMFGGIFRELGLLSANISIDLAQSVLHSMGDVDNSAGVFIQCVMVIHSLTQRKGLVLLKRLGTWANRGVKVKHLFRESPDEEIVSLIALLWQAIAQLEEMFVDTDDKILIEPIMLVISFASHLK